VIYASYSSLATCSLTSLSERLECPYRGYTVNACHVLGARRASDPPILALAKGSYATNSGPNRPARAVPRPQKHTWGRFPWLNPPFRWPRLRAKWRPNRKMALATQHQAPRNSPCTGRSGRGLRGRVQVRSGWFGLHYTPVDLLQSANQGRFLPSAGGSPNGQHWKNHPRTPHLRQFLFLGDAFLYGARSQHLPVSGSRYAVEAFHAFAGSLSCLSLEPVACSLPIRRSPIAEYFANPQKSKSYQYRHLDNFYSVVVRDTSRR
jgi:hypothetical protein